MERQDNKSAMRGSTELGELQPSIEKREARDSAELNIRAKVSLLAVSMPGLAKNNESRESTQLGKSES